MCIGVGRVFRREWDAGGASANLIVAGIVERNSVPFRFLPFLKVAFPLMILQVLISTLYIWMRYS